MSELKELRKISVIGISTLGTPLIAQRADACAETGVQLKFLAPNWSFPPRQARFSSIRGKQGKSTSVKMVLREALRIRHILAKMRPSLIHIHFGAGPYAAWAMIFSRCPVLISLMGAEVLPEEQPHPTAASRWITRILLRYADALTAKSDFLAQKAVQAGYCKTRPLVLRWGVDSNLFKLGNAPDGLRLKHGVDDSDFVFLSPRTMEPLYNIKIILEAFGALISQAADEKSTSRFKIFLQSSGGNPSYLREIKNWVSEQNLNAHVVFLPAIRHELMAQYYMASDAVVMVPRSDGLPQSLMEALACGKPTIVSRLERYGELVQENLNCLMVDPSDVSSVRNAMLSLARDKDLAERLSAEALKVATSISREAQSKLLGSLYAKLALYKRSNKPWFVKPILLASLFFHYSEEFWRKGYRRAFPK